MDPEWKVMLLILIAVAIKTVNVHAGHGCCNYPTYYDSNSDTCVSTCPSGTYGVGNGTDGDCRRNCTPVPTEYAAMFNATQYTFDISVHLRSGAVVFKALFMINPNITVEYLSFDIMLMDDMFAGEADIEGFLINGAAPPVIVRAPFQSMYLLTITIDYQLDVSVVNTVVAFMLLSYVNTTDGTVVMSNANAVLHITDPVLILSNPIGMPVSGTINTFDYPILSNVTLTCAVSPLPSTVVLYTWNTTGCLKHPTFNTSCFPQNQMARNVFGSGLTAKDAGTVTCTANINGNNHTSEPMTLRISGIAVTEHDRVIADNFLTNYSFIYTSNSRSHVLANCATGLGPSGTDINTVLGGWYFNGSRLTDQDCSDNFPVLTTRISSDVVAAISLYQCNTFTTADEGIYSCIMMNSSMMEQTIRLGVYLSGRIAPIIDPPMMSVIKAIVGSHVTLSCTSQGSPPDTFTWRKDSGPVVQSTSITTLTYTNISAVFSAFYSLKNYSISDSGVYTCTVTNPIGSDSNTITVVTVTTALFQLRLHPIENCAQWTEMDKNVKFNDIKAGVIQAITPSCACTFDVVNETFSCRASVGEFQNTVVYRAKIISDSNAENIVNILNNWVKSKQSLTVGQVILDLDPSCPALLDSADSNDCIVTSQTSSSDTSLTNVIIGAISGTLIVVVVVLIAIIVLAVMCHKKCSIASSHSVTKQEHLYDDIVANPKVGDPLESIKEGDNSGIQGHELKQMPEIDPAYANPRFL